MEVRPIRPPEQRPAAALVYEVTRGVRPNEDELTAFLDQARALGTDLAQQAVAAAPDGRIVGCAAYFPMPDRTATATLPLCAAGFDRAEVQVQLLRTLRTRAAQDGLLMLQVFCEEDDAKALDILKHSDFQELAVMLFMERTISPADRNITLDKRIRWIPYGEERHDEFVRVVKESYSGTLDCPALGEIRDVNLTLQGYRRRGEFDPSLWLLAEMEDEPVACLLPVHHPEENSTEVAYVAVVPSHRGKGLGRKAMEKGLSEVALRSPESTVTLAVDETNIPAVNIYRGLDFTVTERKCVYFSLLATA
ncbi:MAG: hypothetical protein AMK75_06735 [Planctomycetes bacterium SM23_65]|nr:MAG: hypothetical protein AMK75_06735 [Planctomycetes bacterium SM23_65]